MEQLIQNHPSVVHAILITFIFQGAYLAMGVYMLLVYVQARKKDYLLYSIYLLLFGGYFFVRIDQVFATGLVVADEDAAFYFTTPMLFLITGIYIDFIDTFAEIRKHSKQFSREVRLFSKAMYALAALSLGYLLVTNDVEAARGYIRPIFTVVHLYSIYSVTRTFIVIKSTIRYYILASNFFLVALTALGLHAAANVGFNEGIYANTLWGFYPVNASQLGVALEMICFSLGLGYKFNQVELEKEKIKKLDALKTQLYTNISHEIRTPLTLISGPIESQLAKPGLAPQDQHELRLVKTNADRLLKLVNQMLDLSVVDAGQRALHIARGNMAVILSQLVEAFRYQADARDIRIESRISGLDDVWFDHDAVEKIGANLLSNATKYAVDGSAIVLDACQADGHAVLSVSNVAKPAKVTDLNQLFKRFYQENEAAPGVGVGLALVKELAELAKGRVEVREADGDRICFAVTLPVAQQAFRPDEFLHADSQPDAHFNGSAADDAERRPTILIVEDDEEIRAFTASIFRQHYRVITAVDGKDGLEQAIETMPDVIITDVMMPQMNGMELCHALKSNVLTSHIPVLMLTARAGEAFELEGYKTGADSYLTKPYRSGVLQLKIRNLLADRDQMKQRYGESFAIDPGLATASAESSFLASLQAVCETRITDPQLTAEELARLVNMSRAQLHRKLRAVFGMSATGFIRTQRIKLACELLAKGNVETVSEIAYQVGFGTVSYFNKCFLEQMGCTPNEYTQKTVNTMPKPPL